MKQKSSINEIQTGVSNKEKYYIKQKFLVKASFEFTSNKQYSFVIN